MSRWALVVVVAMTACGNKEESTPAAKAATTPSGVASAPSGVGGGAAPTQVGDKTPDSSTAPRPLAPAGPPSKAYWLAIEAGRKLTRAGKFKEAAQVFGDALASVPNEPTGLSELSLALFRAGDLDGAEKAARLAAERSMGRLRASALYNLGRVVEAQGDSDAAAGHYQTSLQLRPNKIVAERLSALTKKPIEQLTPILWDPISKIEELCGEPEAIAGGDYKCQPTPVEMPIKGSAPPFEEVALWQVGGTEYGHGWIVIKAGGTRYHSEALFKLDYSYNQASGSLVGAEVIKTAVGPVLRVDSKNRGIGRFSSWADESSIFCGVGGSKKLSCTPALWSASQGTSWGLDTDEDFDPTPEKLPVSRYKITLSSAAVLRTSNGNVSQTLRFP